MRVGEGLKRWKRRPDRRRRHDAKDERGENDAVVEFVRDTALIEERPETVCWGDRANRR